MVSDETAPKRGADDRTAAERPMRHLQCAQLLPTLGRRSRSLLDKLIEEDGGPLIWPAISESEQNAFDATCRKLYQYLNRASPN